MQPALYKEKISFSSHLHNKFLKDGKGIHWTILKSVHNQFSVSYNLPVLIIKVSSRGGQWTWVVQWHEFMVELMMILGMVQFQPLCF